MLNLKKKLKVLKSAILEERKERSKIEKELEELKKKSKFQKDELEEKVINFIVHIWLILSNF